MTRDIFDTDAGTLDIIIYAVLNSLGMSRAPLTPLGRVETTIDQRCEMNARSFLAHFGTYKIKAIKAIREVSGLGLVDAKQAYEQVIETYLYDTEIDEITSEDWRQAVALGLTTDSFETWSVRENNRRKIANL